MLMFLQKKYIYPILEEIWWIIKNQTRFRYIQNDICSKRRCYSFDGGDFGISVKYNINPYITKTIEIQVVILRNKNERL